MDLKTPLSLSNEFRDVLHLMENSWSSVFITGRAGTGKSTLLQLHRRTTKKRTVVLAPTGIAALNVKGQTIHSFFGFPPKLIDKPEIRRRKNFRTFQKLEVIIIDEISMVRADMLDNIDYFLRVNRGVNSPFGGVQMIFFGDLYQLPPVVAGAVERSYFKTRYKSPYFFSSDILQSDFEYEIIELNKVFRQNERHFIRILDNIRTRNFDQDDLDVLNERVVEKDTEEDFVITLTSRNDIANNINKEKLANLDTPSRSYAAKVTGQFKPSQFPTDAILSLKIGAQVMFVKNDPQKRFVNGTLGKIVDLTPEKASVSIQESDGTIKTIEVVTQDWEIIKYEITDSEIKSKTIGTFEQIPIKLAWAITIHKSQGKTFERINVDLGKGAFEYGQTYVALSRCKTLDGIRLIRPLRPKDVIVDYQVVDFFERQRGRM